MSMIRVRGIFIASGGPGQSALPNFAEHEAGAPLHPGRQFAGPCGPIGDMVEQFTMPDDSLKTAKRYTDSL